MYLKTTRIDSTSGRTGVSESKDKQDKSWEAYIYKNGGKIPLGYFKTKVQAVAARIKAEKTYYTGL